MKCADCRYWGSYEFGGEENALYDAKRCGKAVQMWNAGMWTGTYAGDDRRYALRPEFADQMMFVQDGSDYRADLYTRPHFFCAHFEPAETPT